MGEDDDALFDFLEKNFGKHVDRSASIASAHGLLGTHEGELGRIAALLGPDGTVGSQVAAKLAAVQQLEQELRAVEAKRAELEERMHTFSNKGGGVMLKLDELSGEVAGLEMLRSNLEMLERMRKLEEEPDTWQRLQQLAQLLELPDCCGALQKAVRASISELVCDLRKTFTDDVAAAAKDLGWPKPVEIPSSLQHSTDSMIAEWIRPQTPGGEKPSDAAQSSKKLMHQKSVEKFCGVLARLTTLQLIALRSEQPQQQDGVTVLGGEGAHESGSSDGEATRSGGFYLDAWGVECLLSALDIRFRFHFRSGRKTNRLDKPDWFLSYQLSRLKEHIFFLDSIVQTCVRLCAPSLLSRYDAVLQFTAGLVKQCSGKILADSPLLLTQASLLMCTISEAITFDDSLAFLLQNCERPTARELQVLRVGAGGGGEERVLSCVEAIMKNEMLLQQWLQLEATTRSNQVQALVEILKS